MGADGASIRSVGKVAALILATVLTAAVMCRCTEAALSTRNVVSRYSPILS